MPRPRLHSDDAVLDATRQLLLAGGSQAATTASISALSGAPVGSLYHRFGSRTQLLADVWLRTVRRFQAGFVVAATGPAPLDRALGAALWTVDFATTNVEDARLLLRTSQAEILGLAELPEPTRRALSVLNRPVARVVRRLATDLYGSASAERVELVTIAVIDVPYTIVRRHLLRGSSPGRHRALVARTVRTVLEKD
jgi:AcrR family transcriptional regulator